jgi:membrane protein DedA with SNARE-associated domain
MVDEYQLISAISSWGLPVLLVVFLGSGIGVPLPATFLLIAAGSLVAQDELGFWEVTVVATIGVVVGDQIGYMLGRWGGDRVTERFGDWVDKGGHLRRAESLIERWGRRLFEPLASDTVRVERQSCRWANKVSLALLCSVRHSRRSRVGSR